MNEKEYYEKKIRRHREMADHHADMADKGIHTEYHTEKEAHHRAEIEKILGKQKKKPTKKDLGPIGPSGAPGAPFLV